MSYLALKCGSAGTEQAVVIRNGYMIWKGSDIDNSHNVWSASKSFTSTVLGLLIDDGKCCQSREPFKPASPQFSPGSKFKYCDDAMNQFGNVLTRIANRTMEDLFRDRIANPIGMNDAKWDWGGWGTIDGMVVNGGAGNKGKGIHISARELARFGHLFLNRGNWNGRQLISASWADQATSVQVPSSIPGSDGRYCYNWWHLSGAPVPTYMASGYNNNKCIVIRDWNMVIVRLGKDGSISDSIYATFLGTIEDALMSSGESPTAHAPAGQAVWPGRTWGTRAPTEVGMDPEKLAVFGDYVGGRGCVVRHGYMIYSWGSQSKRDYVYSAEKPWYSHFLWKALEDGKIPSLDQTVNVWEPRLNNINADLGHKDRNITWRHLANQTSCYGVCDNPGEAFNYNDYQMALFWDTLFLKVYGVTYDTVDSAILHPMLTDILQCQDNPTFVASGHACKGSLGVSVRDFARFGFLYLRKGNWKGKQLISAKHTRMAVTSPLPATLPNSVEELAEVIPGQRTIGRVARVQKQGPHRGSYSWLWWTNGVDRTGQRFYPDAPVDLYGAFGKNGNVMAVIPSLDLIASWSSRNTATIAVRNEAFKRLGKAVTDTRVSIVNDQWHINGVVTYPGAKAEGLLMNVRMVNCTFEDLKRPDFDAEANTDEFITRISDYMAHGVRAFTLNLQGGMPGYEGAVNSAFNADGTLRKSYLKRVRRVIEACNREGAVAILGCYYQRQDQVLKDEDAVRTGVINTVNWIKACGFTNVVLEINNEYPHKGFDHRLLRTPEGVAELIRLARRTAPDLLVSASGYGDGRLAEPVARASDFLLIQFGKPIVCNEDAKVGAQGAKAAKLCVANGASWGLMAVEINQHFPFTFRGAADDSLVYAKLKEITAP
jgi:CubicO group peptidase (beta-lactamase class C family)